MTIYSKLAMGKSADFISANVFRSSSLQLCNHTFVSFTQLDESNIFFTGNIPLAHATRFWMDKNQSSEMLSHSFTKETLLSCGPPQMEIWACWRKSIAALKKLVSWADQLAWPKQHRCLNKRRPRRMKCTFSTTQLAIIFGKDAIIQFKISWKTSLVLISSISRTQKFNKTLHKVTRDEGYSCCSLSCFSHSWLKNFASSMCASFSTRMAQNISSAERWQRGGRR